MIWPDIFGFLRIYKVLQLQAYGICGRGYLGSDRILNPRVGETWISEKKMENWKVSRGGTPTI